MPARLSTERPRLEPAPQPAGPARLRGSVPVHNVCHRLDAEHGAAKEVGRPGHRRRLHLLQVGCVPCLLRARRWQGTPAALGAAHNTGLNALRQRRRRSHASQPPTTSKPPRFPAPWCCLPGPTALLRSRGGMRARAAAKGGSTSGTKPLSHLDRSLVLHHAGHVLRCIVQRVAAGDHACGPAQRAGAGQAGGILAGCLSCVSVCSSAGRLDWILGRSSACKGWQAPAQGGRPAGGPRPPC